MVPPALRGIYPAGRSPACSLRSPPEPSLRPLPQARALPAPVPSLAPLGTCSSTPHPQGFPGFTEPLTWTMGGTHSPDMHRESTEHPTLSRRPPSISPSHIWVFFTQAGASGGPPASGPAPHPSASPVDSLVPLLRMWRSLALRVSALGFTRNSETLGNSLFYILL